LNALAQMFPIVSTIGTAADLGRASITLAGPYEGSATVFSDAGVALGTFSLTRGTSPPVNTSDQIFPAAGQFSPGTALGASISSGYVEVNVPCVCICNFDASTIYQSDAGDEIIIPGSTPEEIRAVIQKDPDGFLRRRSIDTSGNETWVLC